MRCDFCCAARPRRLFLFGLAIVGLAASSARADILVSANQTHSIARFDENTGATLAAFVTPGSGGLSDPAGLTFGPDGNLYVSSLGTNQILRYNGITGAFLDVFAENPVGETQLNQPSGLTFGPGGDLYVSNFGGAEVVRLDGSTGAYEGAFASSPGLAVPTDLHFRPDGNLYVTSFGTNSVLRFDSTSGAFVDVFTSGGALSGASGTAFGPDGGLYVVSLFDPYEVLRFDGTTGEYDQVLASVGDMTFPSDVLFAPDGNLLVSAVGTNIVFKFDATTGASLGVFAQSLTDFGMSFMTYTPLSGDVNADGVVDIFDVAVVSGHWGEAGPTGDADGSGEIDIFDVAAISNNWGAMRGPGTESTAVPEPATWGLAASGLIAVCWLRRRRRR